MPATPDPTATGTLDAPEPAAKPPAAKPPAGKPAARPPAAKPAKPAAKK
jgi:hypothetical protein